MRRKHRLENGSIYVVESIAESGTIRFTNGWEETSQFGHLAHGYVTTSIAAQGRTSDHVLITQSADSYPASNQKQFYVSVSRGRNQATIYTDDKASLQQQVEKSETTRWLAT